MTKYLLGMIHENTLKQGNSEKAFYVSVDDGRFLSDRNKHFWIPRSVCEIGNPNDVGWCEILVPLWIFDNKRVDYNRIVEINFGIAGKGLIVIK
jgi:hypothetical protein